MADQQYQNQESETKEWFQILVQANEWKKW